MAWINAGGSVSNTSSNQQQNTYGTHTPTVSTQANTAYANLLGNTGSNGANTDQQTALDRMNFNINPNNNGSNSVLGQNTNLSGLSDQYGNLNTQLQGVNGSPTATAQSYNAAPVSAGAAGSAGGYAGSDFANNYAQLYGNNVTQPALNSYDYGTARDINNLDARTAAAGGFANSRSAEIPYSDLISQANLGRANLSAQLNNQGLTNALGFAQGDASRLTQNNQFNTGQSNQQAQFNAGLAAQNNQFNAGQNTQNSQFNAGATNQNNQANNTLRLNALNSMANNLQGQSGLSQNIVNNIVTANGINTSAAQNLFQSGAITQQQLNDILSAAGQYNGYTYSQDTNTSGNTTTTKVNTGVGNVG